MIGTILMGLSASLVGVLVFLRKESLIGEALSHAAYPGVILGVFLSGFFFGDDPELFYVPFFLMGMAFVTALGGLKAIQFLEKRYRVKQDAALCFVLSFFFGTGILMASSLQFTYSNLYRQVQIYFYGQAATMTDRHILMFGVLACLVVAVIYISKKEFEAFLFDPLFARSIGLPTDRLELFLFVLTALSIVIGIRSVGVILMSALLIAPAAAARQFTDSFGKMCSYAALFGMTSAALGTYFSNEASIYLKALYPESRVSLPTGPMIVMVSSLICFGALLFSRKRGALIRWIRMVRFRKQCLEENILKTFWRNGEQHSIDIDGLSMFFPVPSLLLRFKLWHMATGGWIQKEGKKSYRLTQDGIFRARKIVRLHRLWEVYLADYVGLGPDRVHVSAEEMEHVLTPELERELSYLLKDPKFDPHRQPIPQDQERL